MPNVKFDRLPARPEAEAPRLKLGQFLRPAALPPTPAVTDWLSKVLDWPMYGNDQWGDCVWAMIGHAVEAYTAYGQGRAVTVTEADVLKGYSDVTGFDPSNPATDQGTVIQDALNYWRKVGVGGHKILAFAEVDVRDAAQVDAALSIFGHLFLGIDFPDSAMGQFDQHEPWDAVPNDGGIVGGHAVDLGYDTTMRQMRVVTWGRVQPVTATFWDRYVSEAWVACSAEWLSAAGTNPEGLDVVALNAAFAEITHGQPGPFPVQPAPPPRPPAPTPGTDPADVALATAVGPWARQRHTGVPKTIAAAIRTWQTAKGL